MVRDTGKNQQREESMGLGLKGAIDFLEGLHTAGVRTAILCPGGRNAPMLQALENLNWGWEVHTFVDERSAAFFALARSKRDQAPVLVSVTSGTAVAELLPAIIEAHATNVPLILATADRPRSHRGTGSPQSMWQNNIFAQYAPTVVDWEDGETFPNWIELWNQRSPVHINLCHQEPLWTKSEIKIPHAPVNSIEPKSWPEITSDFPKFKKPLILIGSLDTDEHEIVEKFCRWYQAPVLAEASSGIRESGLPNLMHTADRVVRRWFKDGEFDGVIRFGGVPSWRLWRDLENWDGPVVAFGRTQWSGLPGRTVTTGDLKSWLSNWITSGPKSELRTQLHQEDHLISEKREALLAEYPRSEAALVRQISIQAAPKSMMYLGNSRPIREWNEQALITKSFEIQENRGLNGIDGQLSSFYGHAREHHENWALVGDLTALYDMQGGWGLRYLNENTPTRLVIMNNSGGQIFSRMFPSKLFLNEHQLKFKHLADFWGLTYSTDLQTESMHVLIELFPDAEQTQAFRDAWERL